MFFKHPKIQLETPLHRKVALYKRLTENLDIGLFCNEKLSDYLAVFGHNKADILFPAIKVEQNIPDHVTQNYYAGIVKDVLEEDKNVFIDYPNRFYEGPQRKILSISQKMQHDYHIDACEDMFSLTMLMQDCAMAQGWGCAIPSTTLPGWIIHSEPEQCKNFLELFRHEKELTFLVHYPLYRGPLLTPFGYSPR